MKNFTKNFISFIFFKKNDCIEVKKKNLNWMFRVNDISTLNNNTKFIDTYITGKNKYNDNFNIKYSKNFIFLKKKMPNIQSFLSDESSLISKFNALYNGDSICDTKVNLNNVIDNTQSNWIKQLNKVHLNYFDKHLNKNFTLSLKRPLLTDFTFNFVSKEINLTSQIMLKFFSRNIFFLKNKKFNKEFNFIENYTSNKQYFAYDTGDNTIELSFFFKKYNLIGLQYINTTTYSTNRSIKQIFCNYNESKIHLNFDKIILQLKGYYFNIVKFNINMYHIYEYSHIYTLNNNKINNNLNWINNNYKKEYFFFLLKINNFQNKKCNKNNHIIILYLSLLFNELSINLNKIQLSYIEYIIQLYISKILEKFLNKKKSYFELNNFFVKNFISSLFSLLKKLKTPNKLSSLSYCYNLLQSNFLKVSFNSNLSMLYINNIIENETNIFDILLYKQNLSIFFGKNINNHKYVGNNNKDSIYIYSAFLIKAEYIYIYFTQTYNNLLKLNNFFLKKNYLIILEELSIKNIYKYYMFKLIIKNTLVDVLFGNKIVELNSKSDLFFEKPCDFYIIIYLVYFIKLMYLLKTSFREEKFFLKKFTWFFLSKQLNMKKCRTHGMYQTDPLSEKFSYERPYLWLKNRNYTNSFLFLLSRPQFLIKMIFTSFSFNEMYTYIGKEVTFFHKNQTDTNILMKQLDFLKNIFYIKYITKNNNNTLTFYYNFLLEKMNINKWSLNDKNVIASNLFWKSQTFLQNATTSLINTIVNNDHDNNVDKFSKNLLYKTINYCIDNFLNKHISFYIDNNICFNKTNISEYTKYNELFFSNSNILNSLYKIGLTVNHFNFFSFYAYSTYVNHIRMLQKIILPDNNYYQTGIISSSLFQSFEKSLLEQDKTVEFCQTKFLSENNFNEYTNVYLDEKNSNKFNDKNTNNLKLFNLISYDRTFIKYFMNGNIFYNPTFIYYSNNILNNKNDKFSTFFNIFDSYDFESQYLFKKNDLFTLKNNLYYEIPYIFNFEYDNDNVFNSEYFKYLIHKNNFFFKKKIIFEKNFQLFDISNIYTYNKYMLNFLYFKDFNIDIYKKTQSIKLNYYFDLRNNFIFNKLTLKKMYKMYINTLYIKNKISEKIKIKYIDMIDINI